MISTIASLAPVQRPLAQRTTPEPTIAAANSGSTSGQVDEPVTERQKQADEALSALRSMVENGPKERKALAEERLKRLKEELSDMIRFGFAPEVIAGRSAQLAKELGSAARQFSAALSDDKRMSASSATTDGAETPASTDRVLPEQDDLPQAYRDALDYGRADDEGSTGDASTIGEFRTAASQLKMMLEWAGQAMEKNGSVPLFIDQGKRALEGVDQVFSGSGGIASASDSATALRLLL
ncbi:hypothetical protein P6U16_19690 [Rhizobium sp. 32-5/1]|uniref:hypothetical protein n=1 Tax=Rhizobium sp. 32-5/1 TaxID=3019602 RepID=UPI00240DFC82|nr:hypothetical protein [Rhizobium sp. 32-5/1]WEZ83090.1 hypothetical protein P6U16_19690 [Rhizobium sp. 32-5/1]